MVRQSTFMVVAPLAPEAEPGLRALLATLNSRPGMADPDNGIVPFSAFPQLHFARFVLLEDHTSADLAHLGISFPEVPLLLAFLGDCDGSTEALMQDFAAKAGPGLTQIFGHCQDFDAALPLAQWMLARNVQPAVQYSNWPGRTVRQIQEEAALHRWLACSLKEESKADMTAQAVHRRLQTRLAEHGPPLTPLEGLRLGERVAEWLHLIGSALIVLLALPLLPLIAPFYLIGLRRRETEDLVITPRPTAAHLEALGAIEDHDVTNQFSAFGSVKPGRFRLWSLIAILWLVGVTTRHLYVCGHLARVGSIHFARWVFLDDRKRLFFGSNYDGSLDSYMDDFINKVAFGLNLVFSNGIGYPRTRFLVLGGAKDEQAFKHYIRRHQLRTEVWYRAYPGLTAFDLARNARLRRGLEAKALSDIDAERWLAEI